MNDAATSTQETTRNCSPIRVGIAVLVAIAVAAALFTAGTVYGHQDMMGDHMGGGGTASGMDDGGMMGGSRGMDDGGMMGGSKGMSGGGMMEGMSVGSEQEFLAEMIPHHVEAIESAKVLKAGTDRDEMRDFADDIIRTQQAEVDDMTRWLDSWYDGAKPSDDYRPMMRSNLDELSGDALDEAFLQDMLMHHMMAVHMSRSLLAQDLATHDDAKELARSIDGTQRKEIQQMRTWLSEWFGREGGGGGMPMMGGSGNL